MRRPADDPYEVLGLERGATWEEIKDAYRRLARKHHPDMNPGDRASGYFFKQVIEAYEHLHDLHGARGHAGERMSPECDPNGENDGGNRERQAREQQEQEPTQDSKPVPSQQEPWEKLLRGELELPAGYKTISRAQWEARLRERARTAQDDTQATKGAVRDRRSVWGSLAKAAGGLVLVALLAGDLIDGSSDDIPASGELSDWRARVRADLDAGVFESTQQTVAEETEPVPAQPPHTDTVDAVSSTANRVPAPTNTPRPRPLNGSGFFYRGSHADDVARVQGTPTEIETYSWGEEVWHYGSNSVTISTRTRRVTEWSNPTGKLKVRMTSSAGRRNPRETRDR